MMTKITEMSFFKKVITSVKDFERYTEMAAQKVTDTLKYLLKLILIFTLIIVVASTYKSINLLNNTKQLIENDLPEFSIEKNVLNINSDEPIIIQRNDLLFGTLIIDTSEITEEQLKEYKSKLDDNKTGILFLKDRVIILANSQLGPTESYYRNLVGNGTSLTKQNILDYLSGGTLVSLLIGIFIVNFIYSFMTYLIGVLMYVVLLAVLGYLTAVIMRMRMKVSAIFNMSIHSFTLPTILFLIYIIVNLFTGLEIIYFDVMYVGVAYIYIITAILIIKSDLIKRQQELSKIIEEQQRVAEEQKRKEEEEKQKARDEDEKRKQKEKDKKEEEGSEDKEDDGIGGANPEPQGNMFDGQ